MFGNCGGGGHSVILSAFGNLGAYLKHGTITNSPYEYFDKIIVRTHEDASGQHELRIWKSNSILDIWYDNTFTAKTFIAALDYKVNPDHVKIECLDINDTENDYRGDFLDVGTSKLLTQHLVAYAETIARENAKDKIVIDVHDNLRLFNKYYADCGFLPTDRKCSDNPCWIETEKKIL